MCSMLTGSWSARSEMVMASRGVLETYVHMQEHVCTEIILRHEYIDIGLVESKLLLR
jgi:hypothetical protein